jgi:hypothetical protein
MLGLANEVYYGTTYEERRALVEEAMAMAERLGDDALLLDACQMAFSAIWRRGTLEERLGYAATAMRMAARLGDERSGVVAGTLRAVACCEAGLVDEMWSLIADVRARAERLRMPHTLLVLDALTMPWLAMAGRFEEADALLLGIFGYIERVTIPQVQEAVAGATAVVMMWRGESENVVGPIKDLVDGPLPLNMAVAQILIRGGNEEEARAWYAEHPAQDVADDWLSTSVWGAAAEVALHVGDPALAARAYAEIRPYAGQVCSAGSANPMGPTDAFLALAAAATGETALATQHAEDALVLIRAWRIPLVEEWFLDERERFGF